MSDPNLVDVAIPCPLPQTFSYTCPHPITPGTRVRVAFGRQETIGITTGTANPIAGIKYSSIKEIIDEDPVFDQKLLDLGHWVADYYCHPIGEVLRTMMPASHRVARRENWTLTKKGSIALAKDSPVGQLLAHIFQDGKTHQLTRPTVLSRIKTFHGSTSSQISINDLKKQAFVKTKVEKKLKPYSLSDGLPVSKASTKLVTSPKLTDEQHSACQAIADDFGKATKAILLHGITGSGKTEVYMSSIKTLLSKSDSAQVLIMVPEIALTPQMTDAFTQRFPGLVTVVHSELADAIRWRAFNAVRHCQRRILIGPRSSVFAPFANLSLIIVDEEHDQSYKQSSGLLYSGRDVAVVRGVFEKATVVLGSATPAIESFSNAQTGRYHYLHLSKRATGGKLPDIKIVSNRRRAISTPVGLQQDKLSFDDQNTAPPIAAEILTELKNNLERGEQSIIIVNRRGFSHYLMDCSNEEPLGCPNCSVSLTLHKRGQRLVCHYCGHSKNLAEILRSSDHEYAAVGFGSQRAEDFFKLQFPTARICRLDSDLTAKKGYLATILRSFREGEIDILVGTQILAKGHDFPNVTLTVICDADQALSFPDFRAGERTFQLLVQAAGRSGRHEKKGRVLIQTNRREHPVIAAGMQHDYEGFAKWELSLRQTHLFPPASKVASIEFSSPDIRKLDDMSAAICTWMTLTNHEQPGLYTDLFINGPTVPPIENLRGRYRRMILIRAPSQQHYHPWLHAFLNKFGRTGREIRLHVDVDPQNLI